MKYEIILVTYTVNRNRTLVDYFANLEHFEEFCKRNRNKIKLVNFKEI